MNHFFRFSIFFACITAPLWAQPGGGGGGPLEPLPAPPVPVENPITTAKTNLGKILFWDEQLSSTNTVACGTCHQPRFGGSDPRSQNSVALATNPGFDGLFGTDDDVIASPGVPVNFADGTYGWSSSFEMLEQVTSRKSPPATDAAYSPELFWDGRAGTTLLDPDTGNVVIADGAALENQALGPPLSDAEMAHTTRDWDEITTKLASAQPLVLSPGIPSDLADWINGRGYPELFSEAFGDDGITAVRVAMAIATYERTTFSDQTPHDQDLRNEINLPQQERQGRQVFIQRGCATCHGGATFSDNNYHYIGVRPNDEDNGRFDVTGNNGDRGRFRTPALRNIALRAPYFHDGSAATLAEVVEFYDRGGDFDAPNKNNRIVPLNMSDDEKEALVAFMQNSLTDARAANETAPFDRPTLFIESDRKPVIQDSGVAGSGDFVPRIHAIEPPLAGNPSFTIGLDQSLGGAAAVLVIDDTPPASGSIPADAAFLRREVTLQGSGSGMGFGSVSTAVPNDRLTVGNTYYARWYVTDAGAANSLAESEIAAFTVFGEAVHNGCPADLNIDRSINVLDMVTLINDMGACEGSCISDLDGNGTVEEADFNMSLDDWLTCDL
ncbi:cytochrome-c peroxidase [Acanthopleuribacter pedis]|uniref:C-type cytochrome n=1 Tax=Acanthopleuribacter pedis TaxID=442870 RepID=A0A8J7U5A4_9BACT|nr:cytochrome c peroxidase [Acanthopleuribacter pedis]MBO1322338.1 c-type cytochrome [Acanthopleuribacter pedis]